MKNPQPLNIILLGDPASGKATHGKFLAEKYRLYDLDMGRELRRIKNRNLRKKFKLGKTLDKGKLTPTRLVREILHHHISHLPKHKGLLLNGTPKMIGEARLVARWLKQAKRDKVLMIYLTIPLKETIRRMTEREEYFKGKFSKRPDDNDRALKNRIKYYHVNITEVVNFLKKCYPFVKISTLGTILGAKKRLIGKIDAYEKRVHQNVRRNRNNRRGRKNPE
jgi:adenylate kinase family enzyme